MEIKDKITSIRELLRIEEQAQEEQWLSNNLSIKELRQEGIVLYPIKIRNKTFGFSDAPILTLHFPNNDTINNTNFSQGTIVSMFCVSTNENCNAHILGISAKEIELLLHANDFPDWIDEKDVGIRKTPDNRSFKMMNAVLKEIENKENTKLNYLFSYLTGLKKYSENNTKLKHYENENFNSSQQSAINKCAFSQTVSIIHGPPGTGKTTTLVGLIQLLLKTEEKIIASAPSNAALDNLAQLLIDKGIRILRLGSTAKVNEKIWQFTPEGILSSGKFAKELKKLRIQAEEYRKLALQYKRKFGKAEQQQRKFLFQEVSAIRSQIKATINYYLESYLEKVEVVLGTPVGLQDTLLKKYNFKTAILDEAGQCLFPMGLLVAAKAERIVLAGDHFQIPPTVISQKAEEAGLGTSILEQAIAVGIPKNLLTIQYRMPPEIATFSASYFYNNELKSFAPSQKGALLFYDSAGAGMEERKLSSTKSYTNPEELNIALKCIEALNLPIDKTVFISPYAAQVTLADSILSNVKASTIDSFQGQEADNVIVSLVRSNDEAKIGFLSDYRRMNVALTRAKKRLIVIGDSSTLAKDDFYNKFVSYCEKIEAYHSVFELLY